MGTTATFTLRKNAKRAAEAMIRKGTAPATVPQHHNTKSGKGLVTLRWPSRSGSALLDQHRQDRFEVVVGELLELVIDAILYRMREEHQPVNTVTGVLTERRPQPGRRRGSLDGTTGNVVVPDGATCLLSGTVTGSVIVGVGASLESATILGNLSADGCTSVEFNGGRVAGNVTIRGCTGDRQGAAGRVANAVLNGNLECTDNGSACDVTRDTISGNVRIAQNPAARFGAPACVFNPVRPEHGRRQTSRSTTT